MVAFSAFLLLKMRFSTVKYGVKNAPRPQKMTNF
nr:MAG TPA: hypothetical protein [Caudoviricetes sp.]